MPSVFDALRDLGYQTFLNPTRREAAKSFIISEKTVVIRPSVAKAPVEGRYARAEKLLVDLHIERDIFNFMDQAEFQEAAQKLVSSRRIELAKLITYATQRKIAWRELFLEPDAIIAAGERL